MPNREGAVNAPVMVICTNCGSDIKKDDSVVINSRYICNYCYADNYIACNNCGEDMHNDEVYVYEDEYYCGSCYRDIESENEPKERPYADRNLPRFQSRTYGKIIRSNRIFSAEIECYSPSNSAYNTVYEASDEAIGVTGDGSLGDNGVEFQTPKLKGKNGETAIKTLCRLLADNRFTVNKSCGLHIHLDAKGLFPRTRSKDEPKALKQLWMFYHCFEDVLHSFLPTSRRINHYCAPIRDITRVTSVQTVKTLQDLEKIWYKSDNAKYIKGRKAHKYDNSRYCGVNLHSLLAAKHLEIRYHSGTLNAVKILEWANLHQTIMDKASLKALPIEKSTGAFDTLSLADKTELFFKALRLSKKSQDYFKRRQAQFIASNDEAELVEQDA